MKKSIINFSSILFFIVCLNVYSTKSFAQDVKSESLTGTWNHIAISKTPDGDKKPLSPTKISWTFNADGTGTYDQIVPAVNMKSNRPFNWGLNGKDIELKSKDGQKVITTYTILSYEPDKMVWKNHTLGDYYHVEKSKTE